MLPNNGSIVIVDDKIEEARPLFSFLGKKNKSFKYFDGQRSSLPDDCEGDKEAVRLIFLDYNLLEGTTSSNNNSSIIVSNLRRLISENNGPYYILLWSKEKGEQDSEEFEEGLKRYIGDKNYLLPSGIEYLDKLDYFAYSESEKKYTFQKGREQELEDKIFGIINGLALLEFFIKWESQVLLTSQKLVSKTTDISDNASYLAYHLAKVNLEQSTSNLPNEKLISAAYQSLNTVYSAYLNHKVEGIQLDNEEFQNLNFQSSIISNRGRVNSWLNINSLENPSHIGKVFCETGQFSDINIINPNTAKEKDFLSKVQEKLTEASAQNDNFYFQEIGLEISPECDFAQDKRQFYRVIPGILISKELLRVVKEENTDKVKYKYRKKDEKLISDELRNILVSPELEYKVKGSDRCYNIFFILDISQFKTVPLKDGDNDYFETRDVLFSINNDMLQWIKNELASNIQKKGYQSI